MTRTYSIEVSNRAIDNNDFPTAYAAGDRASEATDANLIVWENCRQVQPTKDELADFNRAKGPAQA